MGFPWQRLVAGVWLCIGVCLAVWLITAHAPAWTAAHAGWFPAEQPAVCAAVAALRAVGAARRDRQIAPDMRATADAALAALSGGALTVMGDGVAIRGEFAAGPRDAWLFTGTAREGRLVGLVMLDAADGALLWRSAGVDDPAARCAFNLRRALRDLASSASGTAALTYGALSLIAVMLSGSWTLMRMRRVARPARKD